MLGEDWVDSGKLFTQRDGAVLRPRWIIDKFVALSKAAGLPPIRLHDARHTAATSMLAAGIDMKVVQETHGHAGLGTTTDIYTSVLPEVSQAGADAVAALYQAGRRVPPRAPLPSPQRARLRAREDRAPQTAPCRRRRGETIALRERNPW